MPNFRQHTVLHTFLALGILFSADAARAASANYQVRFEVDWSAATHPGAYPANAHFSTLIGASHRHDVSLWQPGVLASPGIKQMAETGGITLLTNQLQTMIAAAQVSALFTGAGPAAPGLGTISQISIDESFPEVSLVTMIAPSPDWFVGVHNVPLIAAGRWQQSVSVSLEAYDSGTDSGAMFVAPDLESVPHVPIALVQEVPLNVAPIGRLVFTLLSASGEPDRLFGDGMETAP
jgi:hypothetical protein